MEEDVKVNCLFELLLGIKVSFLVLLLSVFYTRSLVGAIPRWFYETTSAKDIIDEIKKTDHNGEILNSRDSFGKTGLIYAVGRVDLSLVKAFLEGGADINVPAVDAAGDTALHSACYNGSFGGMVPIIDYLVHYKLPVSGKFAADVSARNKRSETPLHHAAQINILPIRQKVMEWLVARGANINDQDREGTTVLHIAVNNNDIYGVNMLFDVFGATLDPYVVNDKEHMAPLEYAWYLGFRDVADVLKKRTLDQRKSRDISSNARKR